MKKIQILLVEDNEGDILLTTEALEGLTIENEIKVVKTGKDAIDYVTRSGNFSNVILPDLVLLDINLPVKNGIEVLSVIKSDEKTKHIPVIMLTTSSSKTDREAAERLSADLFISKPIDMYAYEEVVLLIENFLKNLDQRLN
ncbi:response regulator [Algoriphagus sp. AK58]|uniref:response regulator n=1 Tax=Algoriphagus sp. AK58 TaxID=1406877 RepID=UPI00164F39C8|nr:response regulator [Algoriphagus sp. AK58]MBC6368501.1 response regulator [Algoriphagus sp. AK58]